MMTPAQPMMIVGAPIPERIPPGTPHGLEFLLPTNIIAIQQQIELGEVLTGINTNNRYNVVDAWGRRMYFCAEDSDFFTNYCCGSNRGWNINTFDCLGQIIMTGQRAMSCYTSCGNEVQVQSTSGGNLGSMVQTPGCPTIKWDILNSAGTPVLRLESPPGSCVCTGCATCVEADFPLMTLNGTQIGKISKHYGGFFTEYMTNADTFSAHFPVDLDVKIKATLLYATFLIDFMFYERDGNNNSHHHHHGGVVIV